MFYFSALSVENKWWYFLRRKWEKEGEKEKKQKNNGIEGEMWAHTFLRIRNFHLEENIETLIGENGVN